MSTLTYPNTGAFKAAALDWSLEDNVRTSRSPLSGSIQTLEVPGARWMATLTLPAATNDERADVEGFFVGLRRANRLALWNLRRPAPRGTLRGSPTVGTGGAAWGATSLPIAGTSGATLLRGDLIGVGGQLVMVTADLTLTGGVGTATIAPPLRQAATAGDAITWDKPTALFLMTDPFKARYEPGIGPSVQVSLAEDI